MPDILKVSWSWSTLMTLLGIVALAIALSDAYLPEALMGFAVFIGLPAFGGLAALLAFVNILRSKRIQYFVELAVAVSVLWVFYYHVLRTPI